LAIIAAAMIAGPSQAFAQSASTPSADVITQRLDTLDKRNAKLESENSALRERVRLLEVSKRNAPYTAAPTTPPSASSAILAPRTVVIPAAAAAANAADLPVATKAPEIVPTWAGWYVGVNAGGVSAGISPTTTISNNTYFLSGSAISQVQAGGSTSFNQSAVLEGAQVGYLHQWGNLVAGVEAGIDWMGLSTQRSERADRNPYAPPAGGGCAPNCFFTIKRSIQSDWMFTLLGRFGMAYGPALPYITGGMAVSTLKYEFGFADDNFPTPGFGRAATSTSSTQIGFAIGAGVDWQVAPNWSVRGEYLHVQFDTPSGTTPLFLSPTNPSPTQFTVSAGQFKQDIGRVAVSYRFGPTAQTAYAADLPVKAVPPPTPVASWTGFYVGGDAGVGWSRSGEWTFNDPNTDPNIGNASIVAAPLGAQTSQVAALAGFHAGYNWQFAPTWVVGIEGDYAWSNLSVTRAHEPLSLRSNTTGVVTVTPNTILTMKTDTRALASVRARLGFVGWANTLFYATGGVAFEDEHFRGSENNRGPTFSTNFLAVAETNKWSTGWVAGAGLEKMVAPHVSVRAEYLYYGFNSGATEQANLQPNPGAFPLPFTFNWASQNIQVVRAGVSYKF
jgi:outer membrane immunogenic protein